MTEHIVEAFTELAPRYERTMDRELRFMWGLGYRDFVRRLVRAAEIREGSCVLDLCTGTAVIPLSLGAETGVDVRVVGLDLTPAMLQQGARGIAQAPARSRISLVCGSAMAIALADGSVDAVTCGLGMHHLDVRRTLIEIRRVLAPGGCLILGLVGVPALWRTSWGGRIVLGGIRAFYRLTHGGPRAQAETEAFYNIHTEVEWREILPAYGFDDIAITEIPSRWRWGPSALFVKAELAAPPQ